METKDGTVKEVVINTSIGKIRIKEHELGVEIERLDGDFTSIIQCDATRRQLRNFGTDRVIMSLIQKPKGREGYGLCPTCLSPGVRRERRPDGYTWCAKGHKYKSTEAIYQ